jgi:exodeoxyribonuclease-3
MKLISWNVNGIRSVLKKGFEKVVNEHNPDILCLQETKSPGVPIPIELVGYEQYWSHAQKSGYAGTAIFTKIKPLNFIEGMGTPKHDEEGRLITLEFKSFYLVNVYVPNAKRGLERLPYRTQEWDVDFLLYCQRLQRKKPVVFCGDMNVAHQEIDLTYPKANVKNHGFTPQERASFDNIVKAGFIDTFRVFHQDGGHYTWWSPMGQCRQKNIGWRIDYFCISPALKPMLKESFILKDVLGSDHCPVGILLQVS